MDAILFILFPFVGAWAYWATRFNRKRHFLIRHCVGALSGVVAVILAVMLAQDWGLMDGRSEEISRGGATIFFAATALVVYGAVRLARREKPKTKQKPTKPAQPAKPESDAAKHESSKPSSKNGSWLLSKEQKKKFKHYPGHSEPLPPSPPVTCQSTPASKLDGQQDDEFPASFLDDSEAVVVHFDYENAEGELSSRTVSVYEVDYPYFTGMCHTQAGERTFRFDRIVGLVFLNESQQFIAPYELHDLLRGYNEQDLRRQRRAEQKNQLEILFTGFSKALRADLEEIAKLSGMKVRKTVTENLDFICDGPRAGPVKQKQAAEVGAAFISGDQFKALIETGELPES